VAERDDAPGRAVGHELLPPCEDDTVFHTYSTYARGVEAGQPSASRPDYWTRNLGLARKEGWEEPKGRVESPARPPRGFDE